MSTTSLVGRVARTAAAVAAAALPFSVLPTVASADALSRPDDRYVVPFEVLDGRPDTSAGDGMGYWLWRDDDGLHLRTTTHGRHHVFSGVLRTGGDGEFVDVDRVKLEHHGANTDHVRVDDRDTIRFSFDTWDGIDGFDFKVAGRVFCAELENNGHEAADVTHLGPYQLKPDQLPICFQREA
jgi:hypothetical protein